MTKSKGPQKELFDERGNFILSESDEKETKALIKQMSNNPILNGEDPLKKFQQQIDNIANGGFPNPHQNRINWLKNLMLTGALALARTSKPNDAINNDVNNNVALANLNEEFGNNLPQTKEPVLMSNDTNIYNNPDIEFLPSDFCVPNDSHNYCIVYYNASPLSDGRFVIIYYKNIEENYPDNYFRIYNSDLTLIEKEGRIFDFNTTAKQASLPGVSPLEDGGFVVFGSIYDEDTSKFSAFIERYNSQGEKILPNQNVQNSTIPTVTPVIETVIPSDLNKDLKLKIELFPDNYGCTNKEFFLTTTKEGYCAIEICSKDRHSDSFMDLCSRENRVQMLNQEGLPIGDTFELINSLSDYNKGKCILWDRDGFIHNEQGGISFSGRMYNKTENNDSKLLNIAVVRVFDGKGNQIPFNQEPQGEIPNNSNNSKENLLEDLKPALYAILSSVLTGMGFYLGYRRGVSDKKLQNNGNTIELPKTNDEEDLEKGNSDKSGKTFSPKPTTVKTQGQNRQ